MTFFSNRTNNLMSAVALVGGNPVGFASFSDYPNNAVATDPDFIANWDSWLMTNFGVTVSV